MTEAIIGIGSNVGDREGHVLAALELLDDAGAGTRLLAASPLYETAPVGPGGGPYLNGAALVECGRGPGELLARCKEIERARGRTPAPAWGAPRPLDLDILLFGDAEIASDALRIPHPGLLERDFALRPLLDLRPDARLPGSGAPLAAALAGARWKTIAAGPFPVPAAVDYTTIEHTADMGLEVRAPDGRRLLEACAMALADVIVPRGRARERGRCDARVEGDDLGQLVVGVMQEVLFLVDAKGFIASRASVRGFAGDGPSPAGVDLALFGGPIAEGGAAMAVKAATYHLLEVTRGEGAGGAWAARVFLDV